MKPSSYGFFFLSACLCALLSWAGAFLPSSLFMVGNVYPGVVLGLVLWGMGFKLALLRGTMPLVNAVVLIAAAILGWRLAIDVGYFEGAPLPYTAAGTLGGFITAIGLLLAWRIDRGLAGFVLLLTLAGSLGGAAFRLVTEIWPKLPEDVWLPILFLIWQIIFMSGLWTAMRLLHQPPVGSDPAGGNNGAS